MSREILFARAASKSLASKDCVWHQDRDDTAEQIDFLLQRTLPLRKRPNANLDLRGQLVSLILKKEVKDCT